MNFSPKLEKALYPYWPNGFPMELALMQQNTVNIPLTHYAHDSI